MRPAELIRQTLDTLFARYANYNRNLFGLSLNIVLIICIATFIAVIPILAVMVLMEVGTGPFDVWDQLYYPESLYRIRVQNFAGAIQVFGMAILGYYLLRPNARQQPESTREVFKQVPSSLWATVLLLLGGLFLFYGITFLYLFDFEGNSQGWFDAWSIVGGIEYLPFLQWIDSLFELFKKYLPLFVVFGFIITLYEGKWATAHLKKYRSAIWASFILAFLFNAAWEAIHALFQTFIMGLISLPFPHMLFPTILGGFAQLALFAYFVLANAVALVYPFYRIHQQQTQDFETQE